MRSIFGWPSAAALLRRPAGVRPARVETGAREEKPALTPDQIQEQANVAASMLQHDSSIEEVEQLLDGNFRPAQWHMIRSVALAQAKLTGAPAKPRDTAG